MTIDEALNKAEAMEAALNWTALLQYAIKPEYTSPEVSIDLDNKAIGDLSESVSTEGESNAEYITFIMDRYHNGIDLSNMLIQLQYELEDGSGSVNGVVNAYMSDDQIKFGWVIPSAAVQNDETIKIMVFCTGKVRTEPYVLKTLPISYKVHTTLDIGGSIPKPDDNWYLQFVNTMQQNVQAAKNSADSAASSATEAKNAQVSVSADRTVVETLAPQVEQNASKAQASANAAKQSEDTAKSWAEKAQELSGVNYASAELAGIVSPQDVYTNSENGKMEFTREYTGSGQSSVLDNSYAGGLKVNRIYGKSEQYRTTGAQLFNANDLQNLSVTSFEILDNGYTIEIVGGTKSGYSNAMCALDTSLFAGKTVYLKADSVVSAQDITVGIALGVTTSSGTIYPSIYRGDDVSIRTVNIPEDVTKLNIHIYANNTATALDTDNTVTVGGLMLAFADVDWEPYTGGIPSPNPDYPQDVKSVLQPMIKVVGKNLAKKYSVTKSSNPYTVVLYIDTDADLKPDTDYRISLIGLDGNIVYLNERLFKQQTLTLDGTRTSIVAHTLNTVDANSKYQYTKGRGWIILKNYPNNTVVPSFEDVQLEEGVITSDFEPYIESSVTFTGVTLNAIPVDSGGNITIDGQQYISDYVDVEKGKIIRNVWSMMLSGSASEAWRIVSGTHNFFEITLVNKAIKYHSALLSNIATGSVDKIPTVSNDYIGIGVVLNNAFRFRYKNDNSLTVSDLKQLLSETPMIVYYELDAPKEEELTDEQMKALLDLKTYAEVTNIFPSSEELSPTVALEYGTSKIGGYVLDLMNAEKKDEIIQSIDPTLYEGVDLTAKFYSEIQGYSDEWAWIKARVTAGNYKGLRVGDYIPITVNNELVKMQIAGIDCYTGTTDQELGHHIDFISKDCYSGVVKWNTTDTNNGNASEDCPYIASNLRTWLNETLYGYLPTSMKNQIVHKRALLEQRYSSSGVLTASTSYNWRDLGALWIPTEFEVYGSTIWGTPGWSSGQGIQYPIFSNGYFRRGKKSGNNGSRCNWWLISVRTGNSTHVSGVNAGGHPSSWVASNGYYVPICFRI